MKPPRPFVVNARVHGYSVCIACQQWRHNLIFIHEGITWILCEIDYADYWENTDELAADYRAF